MTSAESMRLYSWWWNSHISSMNSKWLQENLKDMDMKVKAMIKLIEEDADSFARRTEMHYKKRTELMKLVEEFYRAYRALAKRYDHATGVLRHAHRTMSEALPNHIPSALPVEFLSNNTTEMPSPRRVMFDIDDLPNDDFDVLLPFIDMPINQQGVARVKLPEGNGLKGLDVHEEEVTAHVRLPERKAKKSLNFEEDEEKGFRAKVYIDSKRHVQPELEQKENVTYGVKHFQEQVSLLTNENQKLKAQIELKSKHLDLSRGDVQNLRDEMSKLESEKNAALLQKQLSHERISSLETEISKLKDEIRKLNEEIEMAVLKLSDAEQQCLALEKSNHSLQLELEDEIVSLKEINDKLEDELEIQVESKKILQREYESLKDNKNEMELNNQSLTKEIEAAILCIETLQTQVNDMQYGNAELKVCCSKLENEKLLFLNKLKDMKSVSERNSVLENTLSDANVELEELREKREVLEGWCESLNAAVSTHVGEKTALAFQIETLAGNVKKLSVKNTLLDNSLDDANTELEGLHSKLRNLEESYQSLSHANSDLISQKNNLISQVVRIQQSLTNFETTHVALKYKHLNLVKEKNLSVNKILNLEVSLNVMQEEHELLIHSKNIRLATLENQLLLLLQDRQIREQELEAEHQRCFSHMTDIFVLQRCLLDMSNSLRNEKQKYKSLVKWGEIQLAALGRQIYLLQEQKKVRDNKIVEEEQKYKNSMVEISILRNCLSEMKRENLTILQECQKHLESSRRDDERIKHLEDRELVQKVNISLLRDHISKVGNGIQLLLKPLNINIEGEKNSLEEENSLMCMNAMTLENLYLFFRSLNAVRTQQLKLVSGDMCYILTIKNGLDEEIKGSKARVRAVENENMQLKESLVSLEELRSQITISEYDLQSSRSFCEELILPVENEENLLEEKIVELSKVNDMLQSKQGEVTQVCRKLEVSKKLFSPRVLLRDYFYGRKDRQGKKKGFFCGCMRPRTQDND